MKVKPPNFFMLQSWQLFQTEKFPDGSMEDVANHCRNPDLSASPWCFTTHPDVEREQCSVPRCSGQINQNWGFSVTSHNQYDQPEVIKFQPLATVCACLECRFDDIIDLELAKSTFRYIHKELPNPISNFFTPNAFNHNYNTRAGNNPRVPRHQSSQFHKSFLIRSQSVWSQLETNIKSTIKFKTFKNQFTKGKLSKYQMVLFIVCK